VVQSPKLIQGDRRRKVKIGADDRVVDDLTWLDDIRSAEMRPVVFL
jgi:hypothetical protein